MNPIEFMRANGLDPEDYKAAPTAAVQDKRPIPIRRAGKIMKKRRTKDVADMRTHYIREYFKTGNQDLTTLFVPYLMLDVMQQINAEHLEKVDFAHKERRHHTLMMERYHTFNSLFFQRLTDEERDKVVEMMDAFSAYIENAKEIFRLNCISCIMELPDEYRTAIGHLCGCKHFIKLSCHAWNGMCAKRHQHLDSDNVGHYLNAMSHHIDELMNEYFKRGYDFQWNEVYDKVAERVQLSEKNVVKKILKFLKEYDKRSL